MSKNTKSSKKRKWVLCLIGLVITYLLLPFFAGIFQIGDRDGPRMYNKSYHTSLYIIGHEMGNEGEKPRANIIGMFTDRPLIYGMERKLKPKAERAKILKRLEANNFSNSEHFKEIAKKYYGVDL